MINSQSRKVLLFIVISGISFLHAQDNLPEKQTQQGFAQLDILSIKMPENEVDMSFSGAHYNLNLNDWSYVGLGFYGAVSGMRGGFFTLGINAGVQQKLTKSLFIDAGFHFGGGGGAAAPDGGGAFILPHLSLGYDFGIFKINSGWSYVNFFDGGTINSNQFYAAVHVPLSFSYSDFNQNGTLWSSEELQNSAWKQKSNKVSLLVHANNLTVQSEAPSLATNATLKGSTIRLAGFEFNSYFKPNWFYFVKADGAYSGIRAGYMDILLGAGYHLSLNKNRTNILGKFGLGAGGGGGVDTRGGFLIYPDLSLEQKLFDNFYVSINKGFLMSPNSYFKASTFGFGLKYYVNKDGTYDDKRHYSGLKFKGIQAIVKQDLYVRAKRDNRPELDMHQLSMQLNFFFNKHIYGAGQTSFANFGDAGAYAEGIVGLGIQSNRFFNNRIALFMQILGGAAGGGGISTGQGLIAKPSAGLSYKLTEKLKLRGGLGYVKAKGGQLSSAFGNIGISYNFSYLSAK